MISYPLLGNNGRFGNQLFQIAATYSHAIKCNTEAIFPHWSHNSLFKTKLNTYITTPIFENEYTEKHFYYDPIPELPNLAIKGYFQSEKYFYNNKDKILELFSFDEAIEEQVIQKYNDILKETPVGVQLRTYTHGSIDPRHIHCDIFENEQYIREAFKFFGRDRVYIVVTDNFAYTRDRLPVSSNIHLVNSNNFYEDFILLTRCADVISSASSFGWWGAYLNKNKNCRTIMPSKWFKSNDEWHDTRDLYPAGSILL